MNGEVVEGGLDGIVWGRVGIFGRLFGIGDENDDADSPSQSLIAGLKAVEKKRAWILMFLLQELAAVNHAECKRDPAIEIELVVVFKPLAKNSISVPLK